MISHDQMHFSAVSENLFADFFEDFSLIPYVKQPAQLYQMSEMFEI